jgi:hypothetical protein
MLVEAKPPFSGLLKGIRGRDVHQTNVSIHVDLLFILALWFSYVPVPISPSAQQVLKLEGDT